MNTKMPITQAKGTQAKGTRHNKKTTHKNPSNIMDLKKAALKCIHCTKSRKTKVMVTLADKVNQVPTHKLNQVSLNFRGGSHSGGFT